MQDKLSILVHGYNKNKYDMLVLAKNLEKLGHKCFLLDLPLTFSEVDSSIPIFDSEFESLLNKYGKKTKFNLVGHSTGGIVIRKFLAQTKHLERINNCVLISTPNKGSELAELSVKYLKFGSNIFKTLNSITISKMSKFEEANYSKIKLGAIAGNKNNLFLGKLLDEENDGRIGVSSVFYKNLDDFIVLPFGHKEIHYKKETALLVDRFTETGKFNSKHH